jgi:hypothetical protein
MKTSFLERKLQAIELLAQVDNDKLLTLVEQLLWDWAYLEVGALPIEFKDEEQEEDELFEVWKGRYEA